jgi:hypothetical protein
MLSQPGKGSVQRPSLEFTNKSKKLEILWSKSLDRIHLTVYDAALVCSLISSFNKYSSSTCSVFVQSLGTGSQVEQKEGILQWNTYVYLAALDKLIRVDFIDQ